MTTKVPQILSHARGLNVVVATEQTPWLVSTSQLKEWDKCKKQFYYKSVVKTNWLAGQKNFELGKAVHKLMDYQARNLPLEPILTEVRQDIQETYLALESNSLAQATVVANEWSFNVPFPLGTVDNNALMGIFVVTALFSTFGRMIDGAINESSCISVYTAVLCYSCLESAPPAHYCQQHLNSEGQAPITVWLTGRVDRVVKTLVNTPAKHSFYWVVDWKTGTAVPPDFKQAWQTRLYLYAIWEARHQLGLPETVTIEQLGFVYVEVKPKRKQAVRLYEVLYSQAQHEQTKADLTRVLTGMYLERRFELPATCPDSYCPFGAICGIAPVETEQLNLLALPAKPVRKRKKSKKEANQPEIAPEMVVPKEEASPFDWF